MEMIKFNYMLEIDILRNSSPKKVGVLGGTFEGFGCPKRHPDTLLAKTMPLPLLCYFIHLVLVTLLPYWLLVGISGKAPPLDLCSFTRL